MEECWPYHPETDKPVFRGKKVGSEKGLAQSHKAINWKDEVQNLGLLALNSMLFLGLNCAVLFVTEHCAFQNHVIINFKLHVFMKKHHPLFLACGISYS